MGFIRQQEERLALRYLRWQYQRHELPAPPDDQLRQKAAEIVTEAHQVARERGRNVMVIVKELVENIKKRDG